jgi:hypothetical protein
LTRSRGIFSSEVDGNKRAAKATEHHTCDKQRTGTIPPITVPDAVEQITQEGQLNQPGRSLRSISLMSSMGPNSHPAKNLENCSC